MRERTEHVQRTKILTEFSFSDPIAEAGTQMVGDGGKSFMVPTWHYFSSLYRQEEMLIRSLKKCIYLF